MQLVPYPTIGEIQIYLDYIYFTENASFKFSMLKGFRGLEVWLSNRAYTYHVEGPVFSPQHFKKEKKKKVFKCKSPSRLGYE